MKRTYDPVAILQTLVRCPSVTPIEGGSLTCLANILHPLGFSVERPIFSDRQTADVENLYARLGDKKPHLMFAGHVDVVPPGDEASWRYPPFAANIESGVLYGRGAVDMKGGIACFIAALGRYTANNALGGSVSLLITGDEEGPAINGTVKLLDWAHKKGETWDAALVGEPTSQNQVGDMVKIGRRGSLSAILTIKGQQGHVAYPERAANPLPAVAQVIEKLTDPALDRGSKNFQPSNLEITSVDTGNPASNVIPQTCTLRFNIRYNDLWTIETLRSAIEARIQAIMLFTDKASPLRYELTWLESPGGVFLTENEALVGTLANAIKSRTGITPELSTSGGTSDARFIKDYCPVTEFGLVGRTMHQVDECVSVNDLTTLTDIYYQFLVDFFHRQ